MKRLTLLFIAENHQKPRQFFIPYFLLKLLAMLSLVLTSVGGFLCLDYLQLRQIREKHYAILAENHHLKGEAQILINNLEEVKKSLRRVQDYTEKLAEIVNFKIDKVSEKTGIGPLSAEEDSLREPASVAQAKNNLPLGINIDNLIFRPVIDELTSIETLSNRQAFELQHLLSSLSEKKSLLSSIPSITPVRGWITSIFGRRISPFTGSHTVHKGIDIAAPVGSPIIAPADGVVIFSGAKTGFGNFIMIAHYGYGIVTRYGHNAQNMVEPGQKVKRGDQIASVGMSGRSTGPHVHYEIWVNGQASNPKKFILDFDTDLAAK